MANKIFIDYDYAVKEQAIKKYEDEVKIINRKINSNIIEGSEYFGFLNSYKNITKEDYQLINQISKFLLYENRIQYLVILSNKAINLQIQAITDFCLGNRPFNKKIDFIYLNDSMDGTQIAQTIEFLNNKSFAINVISQNGDNIEISLLLREFSIILESKVGKINASKYIYVTTNNNYGSLFELAKKKNYTHFVLYDNVIEKYATFSAAVLLPLSLAEINIEKFLDGAKDANVKYSDDKLENNVAYQYAIIRNILSKNNFVLETLNSFYVNNNKMVKLLEMYLSESSLKNNSGIIPISFNSSSEIKSLTQLISLSKIPSNEANFKIFNTNIIVDNPKYDYHLAYLNNGERNPFENITFNAINKVIRNSIIENNVIIYKIPNIKIHIVDDTEYTAGWLIAFMQRAAIMCAYLQNVNPFTNEVLKNYQINFMKKIKDITKGEK